MNNLFARLKQNKAFKLAIVLIVVFFSLLIYFDRPTAQSCQCSNWVRCTWDTVYGNQTNKRCECDDPAYEICKDNGGTDPICDTGFYVCNAVGGCCPIGVPTPTPDPTDPPGPTCIDTSWSACTVTCGTGVQISNCGSQRNCTVSTGVVPNQVTNVRVNGALSGNLNLTSSSNLVITWTDPGSTISYYVIQVWDKAQGTTPPATCNSTTDCVTYQTATKVETYTAVASAVYDNNVYVAVRAVNNSCVTVANGAWSSNSSYNLVANVGGNFYNDPNATPDVFNNCNGASTTAVDLTPETGTTVTSGIIRKSNYRPPTKSS